MAKAKRVEKIEPRQWYKLKPVDKVVTEERPVMVVEVYPYAGTKFVHFCHLPDVQFPDRHVSMELFKSKIVCRLQIGWREYVEGQE